MSNQVQLRRNAPTVLNVADLRRHIDPIEDYNTKIWTAARWYVKNGFKVIPFNPVHKGYPIIGKDDNGRKLSLSQRNATLDVRLVDEWWHPETGMYKGYTLCFPQGGESGFCALDVDVKDTNGLEVLADLITAHGDYTDGEGEAIQTLMAITPSGGRHFMFRHHPEIVSNSEFCFPGLDTRGGLLRDPRQDGGIIYVEPSRKPKSPADSDTYRWDDTIHEITDMPQWLVDVLCGRTPQLKKGIQLQESYVESAPGLHGDGRDRNIYGDLLRFAGIGYTEEQLWDLVPDILERMDPPDEDMVRKKVESVLRSDAYRNAGEEKVFENNVQGMNLQRDSKDRIIKSTPNLKTILSSSYFEQGYGTIEYDDFTGRYNVNSKPVTTRVDWVIKIKIWIATKFRLEYGKEDIRDIIQSIVYEDKPHANIARDYMLSCPQPDITKLDSDYWGSGRFGPGPAFNRLCTEVMQLDKVADYPEKFEISKAFLWFWMRGVAARACVPGCKMEIMLNIFGEQGIGKSLFLRSLCPDPRWFTDSIQDSIVAGSRDNKDELAKMRGKLIVELPELNPMKRGGKSTDDKLKQFISSQVDEYRDPYEKHTHPYPRSCALAGTANNNDVYRDLTGSRRYLSIDHKHYTIKVGDLDDGTIGEIRDAVWGEVVNSFHPGELNKSLDALWVVTPPTLRTEQDTVNQSHKYVDDSVEELLDWIKDKTRVSWSEVITQARTIAGMRDSPDALLMNRIRPVFVNSDLDLELKRDFSHHDANGRKKSSRVWVNQSHPLELAAAPGVPTPPHWSTYSGEQVEEEPDPEY